MFGKKKKVPHQTLKLPEPPYAPEPHPTLWTKKGFGVTDKELSWVDQQLNHLDEHPVEKPLVMQQMDRYSGKRTILHSDRTPHVKPPEKVATARIHPTILKRREKHPHKKELYDELDNIAASLEKEMQSNK